MAKKKASNKPKSNAQKSKKPAHAAAKSTASTQTKATTSKKAAAKKDAKKKDPTGLGLGAKILIIALAVIMALTMMLPSLSALFSGNSSSDASTEATSTTDDTASDDSTETVDLTDVDSIDEYFGEKTAELEDELADDSDNLVTLLGLAEGYQNWGAYIKQYGATDEDTLHAYDLFKTAIGYYDQYLELNESSAARLYRAQCVYASDETDQAISDLEELTASDESYAPAWYYLGMYYYYDGNNSKATKAFKQAVEADADGEYGVASAAQEMIDAIKEAQTSDAVNSVSTTDTTEDDASLVDTLSNSTGL